VEGGVVTLGEVAPDVVFVRRAVAEDEADDIEPVDGLALRDELMGERLDQVEEGVIVGPEEPGEASLEELGGGGGFAEGAATAMEAGASDLREAGEESGPAAFVAGRAQARGRRSRRQGR
jgi:hypothetical protein